MWLPRNPLLQTAIGWMSNGRLGLLDLFAVMFVGLRLADAISWPWLLVLAPTVLSVGFDLSVRLRVARTDLELEAREQRHGS